MSEQNISFSAREMELLALAWQCMETEPKIDTKRLAKLAGYTEKSAAVTLGRLKRKLREHAATLSNDGVPSTPKKGVGSTRGKKRNTDGQGVEESPKKKGKGGKNSKVPNDDQDDEEEFSNIKIKNEEMHGLLEDEAKIYGQKAFSPYDDQFF